MDFTATPGFIFWTVNDFGAEPGDAFTTIVDVLEEDRKPGSRVTLPLKRKENLDLAQFHRAERRRIAPVPKSVKEESP